MLTIIAIDALEHKLVEEFDLPNLKLDYYGKTNISEFSEARTMVLWSSFMTGENKEAEILAKGNKEMWNTKFELDETFFSKFKNPKIIDLPGYNYDLEQHKRSRVLLREYFETEDEEKKLAVRKQYNDNAFAHHRKIKEEFENALTGGHDLLLGYFSVADEIGHLNFGNKTMNKMIYKELDEIVSQVPGDKIVLSDHGMMAIGYYGDHSEYGFWSSNIRDYGTPRIIDFANMLP